MGLQIQFRYKHFKGGKARFIPTPIFAGKLYWKESVYIHGLELGSYREIRQDTHLYASFLQLYKYTLHSIIGFYRAKALFITGEEDFLLFFKKVFDILIFAAIPHIAAHSPSPFFHGKWWKGEKAVFRPYPLSRLIIVYGKRKR